MQFSIILSLLPSIVAAASCSTPDGSGTCQSTSSCTGYSVAGYCSGGTDNQCCLTRSCSTSSGSGTCKNKANGCSGTFVSGACPGSSSVQCCVSSSGGGGGGGSGGSFPGLTSLQTTRAKAIIAESNKEGLGRQGCLTGITAALTESSLRILTNPSVPSSSNYPHDDSGDDLDSVGLFQQRVSIYKNVACDMDPACSANLFYQGFDDKAGVVDISGWQTMDVATLCQRVQGSKPVKYSKYTSLAASICSAAGVN